MIEELKALAAKATQEKLADGGRYFEGSCDDLTKCRHYETGEYQNEADGKLIEALWNNLPAIISALSAVPVMKEALGEAEKTFRWYGDLHAAKPDLDKAKRNYDFADRMAQALAALRETHHLVPKDQEPIAWECRNEEHPDLNHIHRHGEGIMGQPGWTETPLYALEKRHDD